MYPPLASLIVPLHGCRNKCRKLNIWGDRINLYLKIFGILMVELFQFSKHSATFMSQFKKRDTYPILAVTFCPLGIVHN